MQPAHRLSDVGHARAQIATFEPRSYGDERRQILTGQLLLTGFDSDIRNLVHCHAMTVRRDQRQLADLRCPRAQVGRRADPYGQELLTSPHLRGRGAADQRFDL